MARWPAAATVDCSRPRAHLLRHAAAAALATLVAAAGGEDATQQAPAYPSPLPGLDTGVGTEEPTHGYSYIYGLAYPPDFPHFRYVNPDAPKGGVLRTPGFDNYDSFNPILDRGVPPAGISFLGFPKFLYDSLLEPAIDEPTSQYGRLAHSVRVQGDTIEFELRPEARWHDGEPITAEDVAFTFRAVQGHGSVELRSSLASVLTAETPTPTTVIFHLKPNAPDAATVPLFLGRMAIFPAHYWRERDISKTATTPPLGSGPYRVGRYVLGRRIEYDRVPDYWGRDLPVNRGRYNFDTVVFDYFRDEHVRREAKAAGVVDVGLESVAKNWAMQYDKLPAVQAGLLKKELVPLTQPAGLWWAIIWNLRQPRFQDLRVRQALARLYDFAYINDTLSYGFYRPGRSVFQNSPMAATGLPNARELELLTPFRTELPAEVFGEAFQPRSHEGQGPDRKAIADALALFRAAGWELHGGTLRNVASGEPFHIDFVVVSGGLVRTLQPYLATLKRVGISATARAPELSHWFHRMRTRKFDAAQRSFEPAHAPGLQLRNWFASASADAEYGGNWGGIRHPAVDSLIEQVIEARTKDDFLAATRALDRVLIWSRYFLPRFSSPGYRLVHWDRFGRPEHDPLQRIAYLDTWWWDPAKSAAVEAGIKRLGL